LTNQNELLDKAIQNMGNRYLTTMLIAKRIRQLYHGARTRVERQEGESHFSVAVHEIADKLITLEEPSDTSNNGTPHEAPSRADEPPPE
jgi:DNA-directed RNA polymerase subunit K/omega